VYPLPDDRYVIGRHGYRDEPPDAVMDVLICRCRCAVPFRAAITLGGQRLAPAGFVNCREAHM
jgi:hypothetical protein